MLCVFVSLPAADKTLWQKWLERERVDFGSLFKGTQSIFVGEAQQQECEAAGYIVSGSRKRQLMTAVKEGKVILPRREDHW